MPTIFIPSRFGHFRKLIHLPLDALTSWNYAIQGAMFDRLMHNDAYLSIDNYDNSGADCCVSIHVISVV